MTFKEAQEFIMPFGKRVHEALDDIASTDDGLLYLDWLVYQDFVYGELKEALEAYLGDSSIKKELENLR